MNHIRVFVEDTRRIYREDESILLVFLTIMRIALEFISTQGEADIAIRIVFVALVVCIWFIFNKRMSHHDAGYSALIWYGFFLFLPVVLRMSGFCIENFI
ncbi:MAG: hypothetical protein OEX08_01735 [Candidatus Nomurabacteria bacterium]|nr:hypothetical protein [Candidatus Nomurabacteria bacterium]